MRRNRKGLLMGLVFLMMGHFAYAQGGFMKRYDFGSEAKFHSVLLKEDTLILIGTSYDPAADPPQWGTLFVKMDTMGNVLGSNLLTGENDYQYVFDADYPFILTPENTYLLAGNVFAGGWFLQELDEAGNELHFWEYPYYPELLAVFPKEIINVSTGYLVFATIQEDNYDLGVGVLKVHNSGILDCIAFIGDDSLDETLGDVLKVNENTYIIGSARSDFQSPYTPGSDWSQSWIFAIDSLGEVKWEWLSEKDGSSLVRELNRLPNGDLVYLSKRNEIFDQWTFGGVPRVIRRDSSMNLIWETQVSESWWPLNILYDLHPTPDGGWQAVGKITQPEPYYGWAGQGVEGWISGVQVQLDAVGAINWIRRDTMVIQGNVSQSEFAGLVVLPGGSSIAVGSYKEAGAGWRGWVVKTDRNGCVREDCSTGVAQVARAMEEVRVYPNPADELLQVELIESSSRLKRVEFYGCDGRLVFFSDEQSSQSIEIDISRWEAGMYFYRIWTSEGNLHAGKAVVK